MAELDKKLKLFLEVQKLEKELKEKKAELIEICDHAWPNGKSAWREDYRVSIDKTKTCMICGAVDWV